MVATLLATIVAATVAALPARAQDAAPSAPSVQVPVGAEPGLMSAGSELESYLRDLSLIGRVPAYPWSLRAFSSAAVDTLTRIRTAHPWQTSWLFAPREATARTWLLPLSASATYNSSYPVGMNDGPVWTGRGVTAAVQGGAAFRAGPLTIVLDPMLFVAQNQSFTLIPTGSTGNGRFLNPDYPGRVDYPQRFGDGTYAQFDPGNSTIRVDLAALALGVTTANEWWGPATTFPVIVGNNAPGVPRAFIGTNRPVDIWIGRLQTELQYGIERQSAFSPVSGASTFQSPGEAGRLRFMSGLVTTFSPRGVDGLELGAARYFHQAWFGRVGKSELTAPFEGILKSSVARGYSIPGVDDRDALRNQLASVFLRWAPPRTGFEMYAEYGHEDHNADLRDLESEPDHSRMLTLGFGRVFASADTLHLTTVRAEVFDAAEPTLARHRDEGLVYVHYPLAQGHTEGGQLIGAGVGVGTPAAATVTVDRWSPAGRTTWYAIKTSENNYATFLATGVPTSFTSASSATLGVARTRFGRRADLQLGLAATYRGGREMHAGAHGWNAKLDAGLALHGVARQAR